MTGLPSTYSIIAFSALASGLFCGAAHAVPADPERPLSAQTCAVAQDRLAEAHAGSPLLSPDEQARVLHVAQDAVMRLCEAEHQDGALQAPQTPENLSAIKIDGTEKPNLRHFSRMRA